MLFTKTFSVEFFAVYLVYGITDIADGFLARKFNIQNDLGAKLDGVADIVFVFCALFKIFLFLI